MIIFVHHLMPGTSTAGRMVGGEIVGESGDVRAGMCQKSCCSVASRERLEPLSSLPWEGLRLAMLTPPRWHKSGVRAPFCGLYCIMWGPR